MLKYFCCEERRRNAVKAHPSLNGIDFLEVFDPGNPNPADSPETQTLNQQFRQRRLFVRFLKEILSNDLTASNVLIEGGERASTSPTANSRARCSCTSWCTTSSA